MPVKTESKEKKIQQIQSSQSFSPIRDVRDGIICTKDGRFVKLLEFSPINFGLRSADEQAAIISQFAMALRTMPSTLQFKVVAKKSDVTGFLDVLQNHYNSETNPRCRSLQMEQMALIDAVGREHGVSRKFYMAFEYERSAGLKRKPTFREIVATMNNQANGIINAMDACGNECLNPNIGKDTWVLSTLYSIFSRGQAEVETYDQHEFNTLARYASQEGYDFYNHNFSIPVNDLIAPMMIDGKTSPNYLVIRGSENAPPIYYTFCYIPGGSYPVQCMAGWINMLINIGDGVDVDIFAHRENSENVARRLTYTLRSKNVKAKHADDTSSDYDDLMGTLSSGYYVKQGLANNEDFYNFGCLMTITAHSLDELDYRFEEIRKHLVKRDLGIKKCSFQMLEALRMSLPIASYDQGIFNKSKRNALGSGLASIYPFVSYEMSDEDGILLGSQDNGSLVLLDNFDTKKYNNANICIMGSSGAGKTYLLQCMALRFREKQTQVFIIAPDKGHEFKRACEAIGGQFITIAPGSGQNINIMEIRKKDEKTTLLIDGEGEESNSILSAKILNLHAFFSLLVPDISYEERQVLDEALMQTYNRFGITQDNASLDDPDNPGHYRVMPVLGDLHESLGALGDKGARLATILGRYVHGSASSFNQPTNVNLDNKYIVLDVSRLTEEMLPMGMFIALDYVWDKAREDRTAKKVVIMDEGWKMIGPSASPQAATFALEVFKVIRGYGGSAIIATQDLNDFLSLGDGKFGKGVINNSKTKIVMKVEKTEGEALAEALDLTNTELQRIISMRRGNGLLVANSNHIFIEVQASPTEHKLITTDRGDLSALAAEHAAEEGIAL